MPRPLGAPTMLAKEEMLKQEETNYYLLHRVIFNIMTLFTEYLQGLQNGLSWCTSVGPGVGAKGELGLSQQAILMKPKPQANKRVGGQQGLRENIELLGVRPRQCLSWPSLY